MNQKKLKTIKKYKEISVQGKLPIELDNLDKAKFMLYEAKKDHDLTKLLLPTIYVVEAKESLKLAKKQLNDAIKAKQAEAKSIELALKTLEEETKQTAIKILKITKTVAKDRSGNVKVNANGEPEFKETHNLDTNLFSFTPASVSHEVDRDALLDMVLADRNNELYNGLLDENVVYTLNPHVLNQLVLDKKLKLPMIKVEKKQRISIKGENILKNVNKLLEVKNED